ncbi:MAG: DUF455 family protein, partial [Betaproteobacteria bacterium]
MESLKPQRTLADQVYDRILDAISEGSLAAGARITQDELAAYYRDWLQVAAEEAAHFSLLSAHLHALGAA